MSDGGKGSDRRPGKGYQDGWDRIFNKPKPSLEEMVADDLVRGADETLHRAMYESALGKKPNPNSEFQNSKS